MCAIITNICTVFISHYESVNVSLLNEIVIIILLSLRFLEYIKVQLPIKSHNMKQLQLIALLPIHNISVLKLVVIMKTKFYLLVKSK